MRRSSKQTPVLYRFAVQGAGTFPLDMLRYDACWPHYSEDTALISPWHSENRIVVLETFHTDASKPNRQRWQSFGWRVLGIGERGDAWYIKP